MSITKTYSYIMTYKFIEPVIKSYYSKPIVIKEKGPLPPPFFGKNLSVSAGFGISVILLVSILNFLIIFFFKISLVAIILVQ